MTQTVQVAVPGKATTIIVVGGGLVSTAIAA